MEMYNNLKKNNDSNAVLLMFGVLGGAMLLILPFSPYVALILCFPLLTIFEASGEKNKFLYFFILAVIVILLSYLGSTRGIFETMKDDLSDYYKNFIALSNGNVMAIFEFGGGIEFGFSLVSFLISCIFPYCSPRLFLFFHLVFINALYFIFLHHFLMKKTRNKSLFILVSCLFLGFTGESNLLRQSYSSIFILFALFSNEKNKFFFYIALATIFHFSAVIIFFYLKFFMNINFKRFLVFSISAVLIMATFDMLLEPFLEQYRYLKIDAYLNGDGVEFSTVISAYKEYLLILVMLFVCFLFNKINANVLLAAVAWLLSAAVIEVVMSGMSLRINHVVIVFLTGPLLYFTFMRVKTVGWFFAAVLVPLLFVAKVYSFVENKNDMALFSDGKYFYSTPFGYVDFLTRDISNDKREWKLLKYN
ncbi:MULTISPECIES: EpsG family protein [Pectobacterium]|uniref:EpsG family protein n=1 Tax=Pectobacterium TaxID=122277 RepID=UPI003019FB5A